MKNIPRRFDRISFRFNTCESAVRKVLSGLFSERLVPPDRSLGDFYRVNRKCGSRDRNFINTCVYSILRRWGWLRTLMPQTVLDMIEQGNSGVLQRRDIAAMTLFSLLCDGNCDPDMLYELAQVAEVIVPDTSADTPEERAFEASVIFGSAVKFSSSMLAPEEFCAMTPDAEDYAGYMKRLSVRPPMWIRFSSPEVRRAVIDEFDAKDIAYDLYKDFATSIYAGKVNLAGLESFQKGFFEVQDLASMCVTFACAPSAGERWYDACAGAGGKTLHLASLMNGKGSITAGDIRVSALEELKKRARRAGWSNITVRPHDGGAWKGKHKFDGVLVDAPCSGSGVWRRNPGLQWRLTSRDVQSFAERQLAILENNAPAVKPGGRLVYATCSIFTAENEDVAMRFLERNRDFYAEKFSHPLSGKECCGAMRAGNGQADCDELFAFVMRRKEA
ncbi:MAG: RsmB/NOP family class I SAM-dependent RNA methyltransferase [Lentisphaeria bacterium]|nr:RsmB/NOP family class I SAM-dependent RNA methyltransferase [Lentisphaeria bacterium]